MPEHRCEQPVAEPGPIDRTGTLAFVPARFGPGVVGGAEIVLRKIAEGLQARGWDIEVLTTCAVDYFSWRNELPAGSAVEDGLLVRRFPAVQSTPGVERRALGNRMLAGERLGLHDQQRWINDDVRIPELFQWVLRHQGNYRAIVLGPYLFWPAYACSQIAGDRAVLWTCLHDEPYAYQEVFEPMLSGVTGLFLQTEPEHALAHRIHPNLAPHALVGCGVEVPSSYDADGFRRRHGIDRPYLLYTGRREGAKGWDDLLAGFTRAVTRRDLPFALVTMGAGEVAPAAAVADRVIDVGFLPDHERDSAYAGAAAYVQPSRYEAFSRTIMESWLAEVPVLGRADSEVVRYHVERSGAGLLYRDVYEFEEALVFIADAPEQGEILGRAGRDYVLASYQWPDVLGRIEAALCSWTSAPEAAPAVAGAT
ncbi:glycosyltransferase family 4 protein [soil metagenome]